MLEKPAIEEPAKGQIVDRIPESKDSQRRSKWAKGQSVDGDKGIDGKDEKRVVHEDHAKAHNGIQLSDSNNHLELHPHPPRDSLLSFESTFALSAAVS